MFYTAHTLINLTINSFLSFNYFLYFLIHHSSELGQQISHLRLKSAITTYFIFIKTKQKLTLKIFLSGASFTLKLKYIFISSLVIYKIF